MTKQAWIAWMIHNCPMNEMPKELQEYLKKCGNQNECLSVIHQWLKDEI